MHFLILLGSYVTCSFSGQLGNQMFEVAGTVAYALDYGCEAVFPEALHAPDGALNVKYIFHRLNFASIPEEGPLLEVNDPMTAVYSDKIPFIPGKDLIRNGLFLSERYFMHHRDLLLELFAPTDEILTEIYQKYGDILVEPTVAVHVRTGIPDRRNPETQGIFGGSWHYFVNAMNYFPKETHFLIFSDDMGWTKPRFPGRGRKVTFIEGNSHYIDFYFMSLCDHQIVSPKSTYSWWAAWLNKNPNKIVIAEDNWNDLPPGVSNDAVPEGWIKISKEAHRISRQEMNHFSY